MTVTAPDTLLVDGAALPEYVCFEWPYEWPYQSRSEAAEVTEFPGLDAAEMGSSVYSSSVLSVPIAIPSADDCSDELTEMAQMNERYLATRLACKPGRDVVLTRRYSLPGDTLADHTARARFLNMSASRPGVGVLRAVMEFQLLDGVWYAEEEVVSTGTVAVLGDTRTHNMTITLAGAANQTLSNLTNGWSLTYAGTGLTLDVQSLEVLAGNPALLSWNRRLPFRLDPGDNALAVSAGTASIAYRPAYL